MEKNCLFRWAAGLLLVVFLFSCEAVFTSNLFEWAQRDPSNMSTAQKTTYAKDALASGDRDAMGKAYDALKDTTDPQLMPLAAELALGAAGVTDALVNLLGEVAAGSEEDQIKASLEKALESFSDGDLALIEEASQLILDAEAAGGSVSADQYFTAGLGLLVVALNDAGGDAGAIDTSTGAGATAIAFLTAARDLMPPDSEAANLLNDFSGYF
jgi:hypothetical protein